VAEKGPECVTPIITRYTLNDTFDLDKMTLFYRMQLKRTMTLDVALHQGGKEYKSIVMVKLCCNADGRGIKTE
jgi:hypothetical protein